MAHFLSKVLDAILANVELTIVTSTSLGKLPEDHRDHSSRFKDYTFVLTTTKNEENLDISF